SRNEIWSFRSSSKGKAIEPPRKGKFRIHWCTISLIEVSDEIPGIVTPPIITGEVNGPRTASAMPVMVPLHPSVWASCTGMARPALPPAHATGAENVLLGCSLVRQRNIKFGGIDAVVFTAHSTRG